MIEEVNRLRDLYRLLEEATADLKPAFEAWIKNPAEPLCIRWDLWVSAPVSLKNKSVWVKHFSFGAIKIAWFDSPMYAERREEICLHDVVDLIADRKGCYHLYYTENLTDEEFDVLLDKLKEDILEKNLYSFQYDW